MKGKPPPLRDGVFPLAAASFRAHRYRNAAASPLSITPLARCRVQKQKAWFLLLRKIISRGGHVRLCTLPCACLVSARSAPFCTVLHGSVRASVRFEEGGFTPFHHTARAVRGAKAKSVVFAFARYYRNRARSPLFLRAERFRQIECAYSKCDFETRRKLFYKVYLVPFAREYAPHRAGHTKP